ncbi:MAG: SCO family protein [Actinomycetia bacterium]|nr:SCO family protein [Actinomycetes bacterium]
MTTTSAESPERRPDAGTPRRRARLLVLLLGALVTLSGCAASALDQEGPYAGIELEVPLPIPAVVLTDTDGQPYDLQEHLAGRLGLVYFGYTSCPDICPVHLAQLESVLEQGDMPANVQVVFISVAPDRDDPAGIRRFLDQFDKRFVGLVGDHEELADAQRAFGVPVAAKEGDGDDYTFGHAGQVFAFAPDGVAYTVYPQGTRQSHWSQDLPKLAEITPAENDR